jgi:pimeloyl-ACP methyl ester carboxylesterase
MMKDQHRHVSPEPVGDPAPWQEFVDEWRRRCRHDAELAALSFRADVVFEIRPGDHSVTFAFDDGYTETNHASPAFVVAADESVWERFWEPVPSPPYHSLFGILYRTADATVTGDQLRFAQSVHLVRRVLEIGREAHNGRAPAARPSHASSAADPEPLIGRYRRLSIGGAQTRLYYEEAGRGRDLIMVHTAGSDARQFYHLMNDPRLLERCRMVAFDLPWHGRSLPPDGALPGSYTLTTDYFATVVETLADALDLNQPVVLGCSMGGEICLELAYRSPDRFGGVIACEASDHVTGRQIGWAKDPRVSQPLFVPEWVYGLMAPGSPESRRREVWWEYSQGGFGTYYGDISFYSGEWDGRDRVGDIDTARCPVFLLTGEYDYSCTPEMSKRTSDKIPGATFRVMRGLGHFPMAENPDAFIEELIPVLDELDRRSGR